MFKLIIKAIDFDAAQKAAQQRHVTLANLRQVDDLVCCEAPLRQHNAIIAWFCEPEACAPGQGYPQGSLLHYGEAVGGEELLAVL